MKMTGIKKFLPSSKGLLGINARNLSYIYTHNKREYFPNIDNKLSCKELLSNHNIPTPETYGVVDGPKTLPNWSACLDNVNDFVVKPSKGYGGMGIMLVTHEDDSYSNSSGQISADDLEFHIMQILNGAFSLDNRPDVAFFEEKLSNHSAIDTLIAEDVGGVADIRIIFQHHRPVMGMLRLPTRVSMGKANLHQGGLGVGIDIETGLTKSGCSKNEIISIHPEIGNKIAGHTIPDWSAMIEYGSRISNIVNLGYIGVDFICDANKGPLVLEVNARPGLNIQIANQAGLRDVLE